MTSFNVYVSCPLHYLILVEHLLPIVETRLSTSIFASLIAAAYCCQPTSYWIQNV